MTEEQHQIAENKMLSLGVIVPVLNEAVNIKTLLLKIVRELEETNYTICVVDDGSTDGTPEIINNLIKEKHRIHLIKRVKTRSGCQRGGASRCALEWLYNNTDHALFAEVDADGAHRPEELLTGAKCIEQLGFDIAIASKYIYGSRVEGRPLIRRVVSLFYSRLSRLLFNRKLRDFSNSFRFYSRHATSYLLAFQPHYTSPVYLLEMLAVWMANELNIIEIPTCYIERDTGKSKVKLIDLVKGLLGAVAIAARYRSGKYQLNNLSVINENE